MKDGRIRMVTEDGCLIANCESDTAFWQTGFIAMYLKIEARERRVRVLRWERSDEKTVTAIVEWL